MKTLIVREAFGLNGKDYLRGTEISDPVEIAAVEESHSHHCIRTPNEAVLVKSDASAAPATAKK